VVLLLLVELEKAIARHLRRRASEGTDTARSHGSDGADATRAPEGREQSGDSASETSTRNPRAP